MLPSVFILFLIFSEVGFYIILGMARGQEDQRGIGKVIGGTGAGVEAGVREIRGKIGGGVQCIRRISPGPILDIFAKKTNK